MPSDTLNNLRIHFGISAGFLPASIARLGNPGQDVPVGIFQQSLASTEANVRMLVGRFTFARVGEDEEDPARVSVNVRTLVQVGSAVNGTWAGGGDLNGNTAEVSPVDILGWLFIARVTGGDASGAGCQVYVETIADTTIPTVVNYTRLIYAPAGLSDPTPDRPYVGMAMAATTHQTIFPGGLDLMTSEADVFRISVDAPDAATGTVDIILLAKGS